VSELTETPIDGELPVLTLGRIRLREVAPQDAASLTELFAKPEVSAYLSPPPATPEAFAEWIELSRSRRMENRAVCYSVLDAMDRVAGLYMCYRASPDEPEAELGFALAPHLWGTGVFAPAAHLFIDSLFARWPLTRLIGRTQARNHRGLGAMRKLGATITEQHVRDGEAEFIWAIPRDSWNIIQRPRRR
jgi:RimJ/RimL family protein N-acetyltransferase